MSCGNIPEGGGATADEGQLLMPKRHKVTAPKGMCVKCRKEKGRITRLSIVYCKPCFEAVTYQRFGKNLSNALHFGTSTILQGANNYGRPNLQSGNLVIAVSGGAGSMTMLDMLLSNHYVGVNYDAEGEEVDGLKEEGKGGKMARGMRKFTWRHCYVVHVDFSSLLPAVRDQTESIREHLDRYDSRHVSFVPLKIEDVYDSQLPERLRGEGKVGTGQENPSLSMGESVRVLLDRPDIPILEQSSPSSSKSPLHSLQSLLTPLPASSHPHLLRNLLNTLLSLAATHLPNISQLVLGETSTRQAIDIIGGTSVGRGWSLGLDMALASIIPQTGVKGTGANKEDVMKIKPMKDTMIKEAAYYCRLKGIKTYNYRFWDTFEGEGGGKKGRAMVGEARGKGGIRSLERLTEDFVFNLDVEHPSTVSTISRTGSKLVFKGYEGDVPVSGKQRKAKVVCGDKGLCPFCGCPAEPSSLEWKARSAITSLPRIQAHDKRHNAESVVSVERPDEAVKRSMTAGDEIAEQDLRSGLAEKLCYACLTAFSNGTAGLTTLKPDKGEEGEGLAVALPHWVMERLGSGGGHGSERVERKKVEEGEMRESIKDFLLD